jgi:CRP/FNR family cyclic AMP-dependent transcriptional regulator
VSTTSSVPLLEVEPDLACDLPAEELQVARALRVPAVVLEPGAVNLQELLADTGSFSAMLLDGLLLQTVALGPHQGLRPFGPGDFVTRTRTERTALITASSCRAVLPTRLALLGPRVLLAVRRWPALLPGLASRAAEQTERLLAQLMVCQLPRVEDRLLSMMWLLAESWGQVTRAGTLLPWALTHEVLGGLVGARRSTVTLALRTLIEEGALMRQDRGWLLLAQPPLSDGVEQHFEPPRLLASAGSPWSERASRASQRTLALSELREALPRMRERHIEQIGEVQRRFARSLQVRNRTRALQRQIASERDRRRPRPEIAGG